MSAMAILCINLDRAHDRWASVQTMVAESGVRGDLVSGAPPRPCGPVSAGASQCHRRLKAFPGNPLRVLQHPSAVESSQPAWGVRPDPTKHAQAGDDPGRAL